MALRLERGHHLLDVIALDLDHAVFHRAARSTSRLELLAQRCQCRGVQRDVVKDLPTHIDFMRLHDDSRINLFIHVTFINHDAAPGLKRGGTLTVVRPEVELEVLASDIPSEIVVDLTGKTFGDVIHISDVVLPKGAKPTIERNFVIANVTAPTGLVAGEDE